MLSTFRVRHSIIHRQRYRSWKCRHREQKKAQELEEEVETERDSKRITLMRSDGEQCQSVVEHVLFHREAHMHILGRKKKTKNMNKNNN